MSNKQPCKFCDIKLKQITNGADRLIEQLQQEIIIKDKIIKELSQQYSSKIKTRCKKCQKKYDKFKEKYIVKGDSDE